MRKTIIVILLIIASLFSLTACQSEVASVPIEKKDLEFVHELSTLKCRIHAIQKSSTADQSLLNRFLSSINSDWGKKCECLFEYDASFSVGIEVTKIEVNSSSNDVTVFISHPHIIGEIEIDSQTIGNYPVMIYKDGILESSYTLKESEYSNLLSIAQKEIKSQADKEESFYKMAETNGKKLIENFISQCGKINQINYNISYKYAEGEETE